MKRFCLATIICGGVAALVAGPLSAAEPVGWLTGPELHKQLERQAGVSWSGIPLRAALRNFSQTQRLAILIDRRIDPDRKLEFAVDQVTLDVALKSIAVHEKLGYSQLGPVAYFGPPAVAEKLRTLAALRKDDVNRLPPVARIPLVRSKAWRWDDLATPRELLDALSQENNVAITGGELVPHDLWAAADLPPLTWIDRLTLVAAQFDLTFEIDATGKSVRLVPIPDHVVLERSHNVGANAAEMAKRWSASLPKSQFQASGTKVVMRGPAEDHDLIEAALQGGGAKRAVVGPVKSAYTLEVSNAPVGRLLEQLGQKLELEIKIDETAIRAAGLSLDKPVSLNVKNVSTDELLEAAVKPAGMTFKRHDKVIEIGPAKP